MADWTHPLLLPGITHDQFWPGHVATKAPVGLVQPRRTVMTKKRLCQLIEGTVGSGIAESFCPWIRVRRKFNSPISTLFVSHSPLYRHRSFHLLSTGEERASRLAVWLGAVEVREQFPLWPDEHVHPLAGWHCERDLILPRIRGLTQIATDLGIKHGVYPGTHLQFVATTDLMIRIGIPPHDHLTLWQCKPASQRLNPTRRSQERIALEGAYAEEINATPKVIFDDLLSDRLYENMFWLEPLRSEVDAFGQTAQFKDFAAEFMNKSSDKPIHVCRSEAASICKVDKEREHLFFRMAGWGGLIDIDLNVPILMNRQLQRDHGATRLKLQRLLLGSAV